jgi:hypothetical protein
MKTSQPAFPTWKRSDDMAEGMTLRDYFAAAVLQGMYANPHHGGYNQHYSDSREAYAMADVMIKVREE